MILTKTWVMIVSLDPPLTRDFFLHPLPPFSSSISGQVFPISARSSPKKNVNVVCYNGQIETKGVMEEGVNMKCMILLQQNKKRRELGGKNVRLEL